jgi:hypothetical protein
MTTDVCNEVHGLNDAKVLSAAGYSGAQTVTVAADGLWVRLNKTESPTYPAGMTPSQARYLADKLYRCADLVEQRRLRVKAPVS